MKAYKIGQGDIFDLVAANNADEAVEHYHYCTGVTPDEIGKVEEYTNMDFFVYDDIYCTSGNGRRLGDILKGMGKYPEMIASTDH